MVFGVVRVEGECTIAFFSLEMDCCVEHCVGAEGVFMWVWEGIDTDMGISRLFIFALSKLPSDRLVNRERKGGFRSRLEGRTSSSTRYDLRWHPRRSCCAARLRC